MDEKIPILCPKCGKETKKDLAWLKNHHGAPIPCANCGAPLGPDFAKLTTAIMESEAREANRFDKLRRGVSGKSETD